jgi:hypothetical protein
MSHDQPNSPLPPDADSQEDVIEPQSPDQDLVQRDQDSSPLPSDTGGREDIMSADPRQQPRRTRLGTSEINSFAGRDTQLAN